MKMTVDAETMFRVFRKISKDIYSYTGLETLLDYYDEIDPDMEFDPIAICCDCCEFGNNCSSSFNDLINDYGYLYPVDEWLDDSACIEYDPDEYLESLQAVIEQYTTLLRVPNGNVIVFVF